MITVTAVVNPFGKKACSTLPFFEWDIFLWNLKKSVAARSVSPWVAVASTILAVI
ncbi:hypothetical protein [Pseudomonas asiatica]|uniref:hypothetical protein n=1 Tax=Pseudomonas asiatica TaxID=2219225 RepID=UPI0018AC4DBD|nr:hypothetical protein [Pseudomonas asiatica]MBF8789026.1 hypothetical protein [Pseudomonas asiatica]